jgi:hypothetical protein
VWKACDQPTDSALVLERGFELRGHEHWMLT